MKKTRYIHYRAEIEGVKKGEIGGLGESWSVNAVSFHSGKIGRRSHQNPVVSYAPILIFFSIKNQTHCPLFLFLFLLPPGKIKSWKSNAQEEEKEEEKEGLLLFWYDGDGGNRKKRGGLIRVLEAFLWDSKQIEVLVRGFVSSAEFPFIYKYTDHPEPNKISISLLYYVYIFRISIFNICW